MLTKDFVNKAINGYPSLYNFKKYEDAVFAVLHHAFIVLGNGIEWADTGDPETGGYLTDPKYERDSNDEWVRIKDTPYGTETHELDSRMFKEKLYTFRPIDTDTVFDYKHVFESELEELKKQFTACNRDDLEKYYSGDYTHCYYEDIPSDGKKQYNNPYPNFQKRYSCFWQIEPELIKEDWKLAGIEHLKHWQYYFEDEKRVVNYNYYKDTEGLKNRITEWYINKPAEHPNWIEDVKKNYNVPEFNGTNFEEMASIMWERTLKNAKDFISETLDRLIL